MQQVDGRRLKTDNKNNRWRPKTKKKDLQWTSGPKKQVKRGKGENVCLTRNGKYRRRIIRGVRQIIKNPKNLIHGNKSKGNSPKNPERGSYERGRTTLTPSIQIREKIGVRVRGRF